MSQTSRFPLVFMILISLTPVLSIEFPRFLAFWPLIIGLITVIWLLIQKEKPVIPKTYILCSLAIAGLCLASTFWSISPDKALPDALKVSAILLLGGLFTSACHTIETQKLEKYFWLFPVSVIFAALICTFDLATDMSLYHILHNKTEADKVNSSVMNRGVICTIFSFFIALFFLKNMEVKKQHKTMLLIVMVLSVVAMLALTQSQTAQLAFVMGIALLFVFPSQYKASYYILGGLIACGLILTPWIVQIFFPIFIENSQAAQSNSWIQNAYIGNRLEIWNFVITYAMNNPLYGYGIEATNYVPSFEHDYIYQRKATALHPHNFSVQIWIEFGLIGIILAALFLGFLTKTIHAITIHHTRHVVTTLFILALLMSSMTYGLWQSWWLGEFIFILGICLLFAKNNSQTKNG